MNPQHSVSKPAFNRSHVIDFGPATIEHRTAGTGVSELGTYFMTFHESGHSDPWTLQYEESLYVITGEASIVSLQDGAESTVSAVAGDLLVLPRGSTVRYGGTAGTALLLSISPVNWRALALTEGQPPAS